MPQDVGRGTWDAGASGRSPRLAQWPRPPPPATASHHKCTKRGPWGGAESPSPGGSGVLAKPGCPRSRDVWFAFLIFIFSPEAAGCASAQGALPRSFGENRVGSGDRRPRPTGCREQGPEALLPLRRTTRPACQQVFSPSAWGQSWPPHPGLSELLTEPSVTSSPRQPARRGSSGRHRTPFAPGVRAPRVWALCASLLTVSTNDQHLLM